MHRGGGETGAVSAEFVAIVLLIAGVVTGIIALGIDLATRDAGEVATCRMFDQARGCAELRAAGAGREAADGARDAADGVRDASDGVRDAVGGVADGARDAADGGRDAADDAAEGTRDAADEERDTADARGDTPRPFGDDGGVSDDSRGDAAVDAGRDRDNRGRGDDTVQPPTLDEGQAVITDVLGEPVEGTTAPTPAPPAWEPVDAGAGPHDEATASLRTRAAEIAAEVGALGLGATWPDASRNLLHFLGNSGQTLEQDVDTLLADVPEFADEVDTRREDIAALAIERARESAADGPVTFPVMTDWAGFGYDQFGALEYEDDNWFYALGGWEYGLTGTVTVTPPDGPGDEWGYSMETSVHLRDQYNWDGEKATKIGSLTVTDEELAKMHRAGLAQEYTNVGESATVTTTGTVR